MKLIIKNNLKKSFKIFTSQTSIKRTTVNGIFKYLDLHPFKIQIFQMIYKKDYVMRKEFAEKMLKLLESPSNFDEIYFSDEAHFQLEG